MKSEDGISPSNVPVKVLAKIVKVARKIIEQHIEDGLPTNDDGTISLVTYAAWLISRMK